MLSALPRISFAGRAALAAAVLLAASACKDSTGNTVVESLRIIGLPTSIVAGDAFTVEVELVNPSGERTTGSQASVQLTLIGSATLSGETTVAASQGLARFEGLQITSAGSGFLIRAEVGSGESAISLQSAQFAVVAAPPDAAQSVAAGAATPLFPFGPNEVTFTFRDAFGNVIGGKAVAVTSSLAGSTLDPSSGTTNAQGRFVTQFDPGGEGSATFTATIDGLTFALVTALAAVDLCPPVAMTIGAVVNGDVPAGSCTIQTSPAAAYRFTLGAQSGVQFTTNAAFPRLIEVQTDPPATHVLVASQTLEPLEWLLPAGTFRFRIGSLGAPGPFTFTSTAVSGTSPGDQIPATLGLPIRLLATAGIYTGQAITDGDPDLYGDGTGADAYIIFSTRPCRIRMVPESFHAWLEVLDLQNLQGDFGLFDQSDEGDAAPHVDLPFGCRAGVGGGALLIVANNFLSAARGPYTLEITFLPPAAALRASALTTIPTGMEPIGVVPMHIPSLSAGTLRISRRR